MKRALWILGTLALASSGCDFEPRVPADMVSMNESRPLGAEKMLNADLRFVTGSVEVSAEKGTKLYSLELDYDRASYEPDLNYQGGSNARLSFNLEGKQKGGIRTDLQNNKLRLALSEAVPLELKINTGVGDARLSLSGLKISRLELESGVGGSRIASYEANEVDCQVVRIKNGVGSMDAVGLGNLNFRRLEFEGGIGAANLDMTGAWKQDADVRVQVGIGGVSLRMPRDVGVRVEAEKHLLSGLHLDGFTHRDSYYFSENWDKASVRISVRVVTGIGGFRINWT